MTALRYREVATLMRAPLCRDTAGVDIGIVGVPFDVGVTNRTGARLEYDDMRSIRPHVIVL